MTEHLRDSDSQIPHTIPLRVGVIFPNIHMNSRLRLLSEKMRYLSVILVDKPTIKRLSMKTTLSVQNVEIQLARKKSSLKSQIYSSSDLDSQMHSDSDTKIPMVKPKISSWDAMELAFLVLWDSSLKSLQMKNDSSGLKI